MIFYVHKVEKFNWRDLRYIFFTKWRFLAGVLYDISSPRSGKV